MRTKRTLPAWTLALFVVLALGVLGMTGCSSCSRNKTEDEGQKQETPVYDDEAPGPTPTEGPVWVLSKETVTYKADDFESSYATVYELDEHGNTLTATQENDGEDPYVTTYEFDEDGFVTKYTTSGYDATTVTNTLEKDDQGREIKCVSDDGSTIETVYDAGGYIKRRVFTGKSKTMDEDGNWVDAGDYTTILTFDKDGFVTANDHGSESYGYSYTKTYDRDADGKVTGATTKTIQNDADGNPDESTAYTTKSKLEFDENGNLVRVTEEGEGYTNIKECEYVKVEDPSLYVRLESHLKYL